MYECHRLAEDRSDDAPFTPISLSSGEDEHPRGGRSVVKIEPWKVRCCSG